MATTNQPKKNPAKRTRKVAVNVEDVQESIRVLFYKDEFEQLGLKPGMAVKDFVRGVRAKYGLALRERGEGLGAKIKELRTLAKEKGKIEELDKLISRLKQQ